LAACLAAAAAATTTTSEEATRNSPLRATLFKWTASQLEQSGRQLDGRADRFELLPASQPASRLANGCHSAASDLAHSGASLMGPRRRQLGQREAASCCHQWCRRRRQGWS